MIHVLIPVHNRRADTLRSLENLREQTFRGFRVVVVDDGSTDGTAEVLRERHPEVTVLSGDGSLWWTGAINKAVRHCLEVGKPGDFVLTLNNDVRFERDFIERLFHRDGRRDRTIVIPLALAVDQPPRAVSSGARVVSWLLAIKHHPHWGRTLEEIDRSRPVEVDFVSGRGALLPLQTFVDVGLYAEARLPHYGADYELTWRARRHGYRVLIDPAVVVWVDRKTTGLNPLSRRLGIREMLRSFGSIRSTNNLGTIYALARLMAPWYALPSYLIISWTKAILYTTVWNIMPPAIRAKHSGRSG